MKATKFGFVKSLIALALLSGLQTAGHANATTGQADSSAWVGGSMASPQLIVNVQSAFVNNSASGMFGLESPTFYAYGNCFSTVVTSDATGLHATVQAYVMFNDTTEAIATLIMTQSPNGSTCEGYEIDAYLTNAVLATSGKNAKTGVLTQLPVVYGSVFITPPVTATAAVKTTKTAVK